MADLRRQTGDVRTSTVDPRLYRHYDMSGAANSLTRGLNNVGSILSGADTRRTQAERARLTTLENEAQDTAAQDMMLAATDQIDELVANTISSFDDQVDVQSLSPEDRIVHLLRLAEGQGKKSTLNRVRALANLQSRLAHGDPEKAYEYLMSYQQFAGRSFLDEIRELADESQSLDLTVDADAIAQMRTDYNMAATATAREVLEFDRTRSQLQMSYDALLMEKQVATTQQELFDIRSGKRMRTAANHLSIQMQTALNGVLINPETGEFRNFAAMGPAERTRLVGQMEYTYNQMIATMATNLSSEESVVTAGDILAANPLIESRLSFAKKVASGELEGQYAEALHKYYMDMERNNFLELPNARKWMFTVEVLSEIEDPDTVVELKNLLIDVGFDPVAGIAGLLSGDFVNPPDPVEPRAGAGTEMGIGVRAGAPEMSRAQIRAQEQEREQSLREVRAGLSFIGIDLSNEQFDPLSDSGKSSVRALRSIGRHLADSPGRISQPYMREFAKFVATEEGFQALQNAANANGYDEDLFAQFKRGFDNYLQRTAASLANYLRDELKPGGLFHGGLTDTITYEIMPDGRIAFLPQAGYNRNEVPRATVQSVEAQVKQLNSRYSDAITSQVRSYAHLNNSINNYQGEDGRWDYRRAFVDLMSMGEFNVNESNESILDLIRSRYPDLADVSEEEFVSAYTATNR